jgi:hypothetical protein
VAHPRRRPSSTAGIVVRVIVIATIVIGVVISFHRRRRLRTFDIATLFDVIARCSGAILLIQELFDLLAAFGIDLDQVERIGCASARSHAAYPPWPWGWS